MHGRLVYPHALRRKETRVSAHDAVVCIVDDDQSFRRGLCRLVTTAGYEAETFSSGEEYLARPVDGPVCILLDVRMPGLNGPGLQEAVRERGSGEHIVFITGHIDVPTCTEAMKKGAVDFLLKPFDAPKLIAAVERALGRSRDFLQGRAERREARSRIDTLTPREFEVLRLVLVGMLNKQIAASAEYRRDDGQSSPRPGHGKAGAQLGARFGAPVAAGRRGSGANT